MKRFIAATFALIGLALTTGAFAAPPEADGAARAADDQVGRVHQGPEDVTFTPPACPHGWYHCDGTATTLICECDELEEE